MCNTNLSEVIDIPVQVVHIWTNPWSERVFYNDRRLLSEVSESQGTFESTLTLNTTQPMDGGIFTCSAIVKARLSEFVIESLRKNASVSINPGQLIKIYTAVFKTLQFFRLGTMISCWFGFSRMWKYLNEHFRP